MSISPLSRSSFSSPALNNAPLEPVSAPVQSLGNTPALQPQTGPWQNFMADSFEQGPGKLGAREALGASGGLGQTMDQLTQVFSEISQLLESLGAPSATAGAPSAPSGAQASGGAPSSQNLVPDLGDPAHATYDSDAGPGFGPPSAGSTDPVNPAEPWLAKNNVGSPYNSNMQLIEPGEKSQFKFTNTFSNTTNEPQTVTLWNKTGEHGGPNDGQHFDKSTPKTFTLQPGQSQTVAFDNNTSVAWAVSKDGSSSAGANFGQTWGEATFGNSGTGWSGYDTSQISPAGHSGRMSITNEATGVKVTEADAWQTPQDNPAGHDIGVPAGPMHLSTTLG
jgi:hypothetical protein